MLYYILRYGEIALKSKNRNVFENKLKSNILNYLKNKYNLDAKISSIRGRMILEIEEQVDTVTESIRGRIFMEEGRAKLGGLDSVIDRIRDIDHFLRFLDFSFLAGS
jgi:thiamine biosynthesis protein ThiI